ncbi:MAG: aldehyde dehydrogenase family protein [Deltaproteobacteria bacterium]|nr:aldehyde dehydrogenase family protein [Deltaproteobacteria bacterium]
MVVDSLPFYLAGSPEAPNADLEVFDKFSGEPLARVALADEDTIDSAIESACAAAAGMAAMPAWRREQVLLHCVARFEQRAEELALGLCAEAGKPIRDARGEVGRLIDTFRYAAGESLRMGGEVMPLDISPRATGYSGSWKRVPVGPCSFITPFNFPLNLVAHKVAPAIAAGCPFVLKPASLTPLGALTIGEILAETDLPAGAFSILPCRRDAAERLITDDRLALLSFTGSPAVGWDLKARAGRKKTVLELGGNAAVVVDETADLADAAERIVFGAFYQSGQSCIGVQRIIVQASVYDELLGLLVAATGKLVVGDPAQEETFVGPMISEDEAARLESWIEGAVAAGGRLLCGGGRDGALHEPSLLEGVPKDCELVCREAFGPVAVLSRFDHFDEALAMVNDSDFGLQAGVFTRDVHRAQQAWDELEVGGVVIGDVPSWRVDHMPYGGVKQSGLGREGVRYAMEDMSEIRMMVLRRP